MSPSEPSRSEQPVRPPRQAEPPLRRPPAEAGRQPLYRRPVALLSGIVILLALVVGGALWWREASRYESTDDAFIATQLVRVAPQVSGRVARVFVDDNQVVAAGAPLLELDPADYQAKLDQALADQAAAQGNLAQAKAQQLVAEANADEARAEVGVAEANATNADNQLKRDQPLAASHVVSSHQLDNDIASARSTAATLAAARKKQAAAEAQLAVAASLVTVAEANLKSAAAQLEQARLNLSYTRIVAPEAGHIAHKDVAAGNYVQIGQNLMALVPLRVWGVANFKETQLGAMRVGQPVEIRLDAYSGRVFHGHVDSFQPGSGAAFSLLPPENATGNYVKVVQRVPVKIVFDNLPGLELPLGPGMSVVPTVQVR